MPKENILLAYRKIKSNTGSKTAGTDKLTIANIGKLTPEEVTAKVRYIIAGTKRGYRPKPVKRKDIPLQTFTLDCNTVIYITSSNSTSRTYKHLLGTILRMLKAPIKLPDGKLIYPQKQISNSKKWHQELLCGNAQNQPQRNVYRALC